MVVSIKLWSYSMKHLLVALTALVITGSAVADLSSNPKITLSDNYQENLLYSYDFRSEEQLSDWTIEGFGVARVENGRMILEPEFHAPMIAMRKEGKFSEQNSAAEYGDTLARLVKENYLLISSHDGAVIIWGQNAQGDWKVRGREQHDSKLEFVEFSQSGFHALTVDWSSIRIWGRDEDGSWFVKGGIRVRDVMSAHFHTVAEHLIVFRSHEGIQVWEVRKDD